MLDFSNRQTADGRPQKAYTAAIQRRLLTQVRWGAGRPRPLSDRLWPRETWGVTRLAIRQRVTREFARRMQQAV